MALGIAHIQGPSRKRIEPWILCRRDVCYWPILWGRRYGSNPLTPCTCTDISVYQGFHLHQAGPHPLTPNRFCIHFLHSSFNLNCSSSCHSVLSFLPLGQDSPWWVYLLAVQHPESSTPQQTKLLSYAQSLHFPCWALSSTILTQ